MAEPHNVLQHPASEFIKSKSGQVVSVHVRLREGKAVSAVQPDRSRRVFFELGDDRLPIGITFLEHAPGVAVSILYDFFHQAESASRGDGGSLPRSPFLSREQIHEIATLLDDAARQLEHQHHPSIPAA